MQDAVDKNTVEFGVEIDAELFGIGTDRIQRNENIAVERGGCGIIESDDIGIVVVPEELAVDFEFAFIGTEDIIDVAYSKAIAGGHGFNPTDDSALVERWKISILSVKGYHIFHPKKMGAMAKAAMAPARSARRQQATAWRVSLILTAPK